MSSEPMPLKSVDVLGRRMTYAEMGEGAPVIFQHGNPTSSYLWRNIMPKLADLGRCIAVDLIGMGGSDKLPSSGPMAYDFDTHARHLYAAWEALDVERDAIMVLHDWGSVLGFNWVRLNAEKVQGVAYMEGFVRALRSWEEWPEGGRNTFNLLRSEAGEELVLERNFFIERILPSSIIRPMSDAEMDAYRAPYHEPGEGRRPTLDWPRQLPIAGEPASICAIADAYGDWFAQSPDLPKLFINAEPGSVLTGPQRAFCRSWPNQTEATVKGLHFIQEDSPDEIAAALRAFIEPLRA